MPICGFWRRSLRRRRRWPWTTSWSSRSSRTPSIRAEMKRRGFKFWYRNPPRPTQDSLGIAYVEGDTTKIMRPDFLFFAEEGKGKVVVDIVDPHNIDWADGLPKLQGLARFAETHAHAFRRIEAVAEVNGKLRVLDLMRPEVREAAMSANSAKEVYAGDRARNYPGEQ